MRTEVTKTIEKHILVFATNISTSNDRTRLSITLEQFKDITKWNIDIWDIDNVLRIESPIDCSELIIQQLSDAGFYCRSLED